jgi:fructose-bisphosphate aldolase class II
MVHFDGSTADYESNINLSQYFVNKIRAINPEILVEVEFNKIKAVGEAIDPESLTKVEEAKDFMNRSGAEMLAVSIGNLHGVNINSPERLDLELLKKIAGVLPDKFLAMHGGSGIDQVQLKEAIKMGIVKINVNTDLRLAFRKGMIKGLAENKGDKVYEWMRGAVEEVKRVVRERLLNGASR